MDTPTMHRSITETPQVVVASSGAETDEARRAPSQLSEAPGRIPGLVAFGTIAVWAILMVVLDSATPAVDPDAPISTTDAFLALTFWSSLLAGAFALAARLRSGLAISAGAAAILGIGAVTCYAGGHTGAWLAIQSGMAIGLGGVSAALYRFSPGS